MRLTEAEAEAIHSTFHRLEQRWNALPVPAADVWHAYDPLPFWDFLAGLRRAAELTEGRRLLDVGCGIGRNMALAHHLGWQVSGIDRHLPYVEAAWELLPEANVRYVSVFAVNEFPADLVYMYRPARADALEDRLEAWVLEHLQPGTVCFFPLRHNPDVWVV